MVMRIKSVVRPVWIVLALVLLSGIAVAWAAEPAGDLRFERKGDQASTGPFPPSIFEHWVHRVRYRCDACHDRLFTMQAGSSEITMDSIARGEACGACHDGKLAFDDSFENCSRCHRPSEK
jgi:c(7)-type cytochrome triheme protein